mmetsp:Transcript_8669/g.15674  ORF Transcript_8669/g.15674 Transcript_8669/m.15674 type:complete len:561 (-) Transcript_8669:1924-3606(-)
MKLRCALSGMELIPTDSNIVIDPHTGFIYNRSTIETHLKLTSNTCPFTNQPLSPNTLIPIQYPLQPPFQHDSSLPVSTQSVSVNAMLKELQLEYDRVAVNLFEMHKKYQESQKQLAMTLLQLDAAHRIIAKSIPTENEKQNRVAEKRGLLEGNEEEEEREQKRVKVVEEEEESENVMKCEVEEYGKRMLESRKTMLGSELMAKRKKSSVEVNGDWVKFGGIDGVVSMCSVELRDSDENVKEVIMFLLKRNGMIALSNGHGTGCGTIRVEHRESETLSRIHVVWCSRASVLIGIQYESLLNIFSIPVSSLTGDHATLSLTTPTCVVGKRDGTRTQIGACVMHGGGKYVFVSYTDRNRVYCYEIEQSGGKSVMEMDVKGNVQTMAIHPDGLLLGVSVSGESSGSVYMFDVSAGVEVAELKVEGRSECEGNVSEMKFLENGYQMLVRYCGGVCRMWDLRKLNGAKVVEMRKSEAQECCLVVDKFGCFCGIMGMRAEEHAWVNRMEFLEHRKLKRVGIVNVDALNFTNTETFRELEWIQCGSTAESILALTLTGCVLQLRLEIP